MIYKVIGKRIRKKREEAGMSQKGLADKIGFKSATGISLLESGARRVSLNDLQKIAEALETNIAYFLNSNDGKVPNLKAAIRAEKSLSKSDKDKLTDFYFFLKRKKKKK